MGTNMSIANADNILILVGPSSIRDYIGDWQQALIKVGLVQGFSWQTGRSVQRVGEVGSTIKKLLIKRAGKNLSMSRLIFNASNITKALYAYEASLGVDIPDGNIWLDPSHPLLSKPIGICMQLYNLDDNNQRTMIAMKYFEDVRIGTVGHPIREGDRGIAESISGTWTKTRNFNFNNS